MNPRNKDFLIDDAKKQIIADAFAINKSSVDDLYQKYVELIPHIKNCCLSNLIRAMEEYFREVLKYRFFTIICKPYKEFEDGQKKSSAQYHRGQRFIIYYKRNLNDKELRVHIAHELGHLFLIACKDSKTRDKREAIDERTEPLSSIFGIFTISEKNDFYYNAQTSGRAHKDWNSILEDFQNLHNP